MMAHKLITDFDTMALKTKTTNICLKKGNSNLAYNIKSAKPEVIPAGHENIINGKLVAKGSGEIMTTHYVGIIESGLRFYWFGMRRDAENYVANCVECVTRKNQSRTAGASSQPHYSGGPFEKIAIDILEMPMSDQGNRFIVVIGDYFSLSGQRLSL
ncbi:unnamed protein product [Mytilus edulis]|uniref:Integrase zinc-binding domain-containing protein n=1 Tax=Mytilus edulis TaxID=6550 RepID=A0A8S3T5L2_MYTED|nr:unnamed protein product [Mytilus edulis]